MVSKLIRLAFGLSILSKVLCQEAMTDRPAQYTDDIPDEEKMALASIIEDNSDDMSIAAKDWESPEYPLIFRQALPIPPAKQPK
jgi:hypothetical protein